MEETAKEHVRSKNLEQLEFRVLEWRTAGVALRLSRLEKRWIVPEVRSLWEKLQRENHKLTGFWRKCRSFSGEWKVEVAREGPLR